MVRLRQQQHKLFETKNLLYYGDNLPILWDRFSDDSVDLVYLDPPFKSGKDYNILFTEKDGSKAAAQIKAFGDTWRWDRAAVGAYQECVRNGPADVSNALVAFKKLVGQSDILAYLSMMAPRLVELRRVLRPTGSIFLHCDPTASHYLKLLMDAVFGPGCFRNEIIWHYRKWPSGKYAFQRNHDVIFFYSRTDTRERVFNQLYMDRAPSTLKRFGKSRIISGHDPATGLRVPSQMALTDSEGVRMDDVWDIGRVPPIKQWFPTEKPKVLLERIIDATTKPGDVVLDPFCGCGTTIVTAQDMGRRWFGIDVTRVAIDVIEKRLVATYGEQIKDTYEVLGDPFSAEDALTLAREDKYEFQWWACRKLGANPTEEKKGRDKGIDGRTFFHDLLGDRDYLVVISVKGGGTGPGHVRDLRGVLEREKAAIGVLVTLKKPTPDMLAEAAEAGAYYLSKEHRFVSRLQILTVEDLIEGRGIDYPSQPFETAAEPIREPSAAERQSRRRAGG